MIQPVLRTAGPEDVPAIHALVESAYRGDSARQGWTHEADLLDGQRTSAAIIAAMIADPEQRIVLALLDERLAGSVAIRALGAGRAYLGMFAVAPVAQGTGLGRALIAGAEAEAQQAFGATCMEMTVIARRRELIAWYERRGYGRTGEERPFPDPVPNAADLRMVVLERAIV